MPFTINVVDSNTDQVIDSNIVNVVITATSISYAGSITATAAPASSYEIFAFTWTPDASFSQIIGYNTLITNTTYGKERRRNKWATPKHSFSLQFINIAGTTASDIIEFYDTKHNLQTFYWSNPDDGVKYKVRFSENTITQEYTGEDNYNITFDLVEVL